MVVLTEILPGSSSSSSSTHDHKHKYCYDVFLSFRGADTRNRFTDHLYTALLDAGIITFLDDEEIETGEPLKPELESAIESSRASVIVLSKNYASSTWCLEELVLILEQKRKRKQIVIPIFYDVEPTDVRKQHKSCGKAMAKHEQRMKEEIDVEKRSELAQKLKLWKKALSQVADLKGEVAKDKKETEFIKNVVLGINRRLGVILSNNLPCLIGMDYYIKFIGSWLTDGSSHSVDILTIVGMSGIGKTSLARYVFGLHSCKFDKSSFIEGINARCKENLNGLFDLHKQLCRDISKNISLQVHDASIYTFKVKNVLAHKKVLLVLDDVGCLDQLDVLLGDKGFQQGSKIIITTNDASLTERCALFNLQLNPMHKIISLKGLYKSESLELLCIHAFKSNKPKEGYKEVSEMLVKYCEGHPLALKVLGSSLLNRDVTYWESFIKVLKKEPDSCINNALKMSYNFLPFENDKELLKHIACFFVGKNKDITETILNACDLNTRSGITNLIDKCFISIGLHNEFKMHQLVKEMGRDLVRQESLEKPCKRSRLWCHEESFKVLKQKKGKGSLLGLAVLPMENLVALDMSYSDIEYFGMSYSNPQPPAKKQKGFIGSSSKDNRVLGSLKILDLSFCEQLYSVSGFSELPALEMLIVRKCINLVEVCESVEQCVELFHIDMSYCFKLKSLPMSIGKLKKVEKLLLDGCNFHESHIKAVPSDLKLISFSLPSSLRTLSIANCNLCNESFPLDFGCLSMLEELYLDKNPIVSMPDCVRTLPKLKRLFMNFCDKLISIEHPPPTLRELSIFSIEDLIRKVKFVPEMSPLSLYETSGLLSYLPFEIDGMIKIQDMTGVMEKVLHNLGWIYVDYIKGRHLNVCNLYGESCEVTQTQMYYEFGKYSTVYWGDEIPSWICYRNEDPSISVIIPSSSKRLKGLNFCCIVDKTEASDKFLIELPMIKISNITKNVTWIYNHYIRFVKLDKKCCYSLLSHWMFGPSEMKVGDHITITIAHEKIVLDQVIKECGIGLVYDEENEEEQEDALGYYKSWNHIIGGDLSPFQLTTGEYILYHDGFVRSSPKDFFMNHTFIDYDARFKVEEEVKFIAFSQKKFEMDTKAVHQKSPGKATKESQELTVGRRG